jgi:hypothetical protein
MVMADENINEPELDETVDDSHQVPAQPVVYNEPEPEPEVSQERVSGSTLLIEVESGQYPVTLASIFSKHHASFPSEPLLYDLEQLGYAKVEPTPQPEGDVVTEGKPVQEDGVWKRVWNVREWDPAEIETLLIRKKEELSQQVMSVRYKDCSVGMPYELDSGETLHVQIRSDDKINLLALNLEAQTAQAAGSTEPFEFRFYENVSAMLTPEQVVGMTRSALVCIKAVYKASWDIKDQIDQSASIEELPAIPETLMPSAEVIARF